MTEQARFLPTGHTPQVSDRTYGHRSIRLTSAELDDICYRHCELGETLSEDEIDRLIDTASAALALAEVPS